MCVCLRQKAPEAASAGIYQVIQPAEINHARMVRTNEHCMLPQLERRACNAHRKLVVRNGMSCDRSNPSPIRLACSDARQAVNQTISIEAYSMSFSHKVPSVFSRTRLHSSARLTESSSPVVSTIAVLMGDDTHSPHPSSSPRVLPILHQASP